MKLIKQFKSDPAEALKMLVTSAEAASILSVSTRTLWRMTKEGTIPCIRFGRAVRYDPEVLYQYIADNFNLTVIQRPQSA